MLTRLIDTWLAARRANGFALRHYERHLHRFAEFAAARGEDHIRTETAIAWARQAGTPGGRCRHFQRVVQLARYLHAADGRHEIPPAGHFPGSRHRPVPYIYTPDAARRLIAPEGADEERHQDERQRHPEEELQVLRDGHGGLVRGEFLEDAEDRSQRLASLLAAFEPGAAAGEAIHETFRAAHDLKSASATAGFHLMSRLAHRMEDVLHKVRDGTLEITEPVRDALLAGSDRIA